MLMVGTEWGRGVSTGESRAGVSRLWFVYGRYEVRWGVVSEVSGMRVVGRQRGAAVEGGVCVLR